jgi:hypothetical protein
MRRLRDPRLARTRLKHLYRLIDRDLPPAADECVFVLGAIDVEDTERLRVGVSRLRKVLSDNDAAPPIRALFAEICDALGVSDTPA